MLSRRSALAVLAVAAAALPAFAADKQKYTDAAFDAALKAGKPILVEVHAPWCPTCKQQAPHLSKITGEDRFKSLVVFSVDFDSQKDALKKINARQQSTLIVYKGGKELDRSVGDTDPNSIKMLIEGTL